MLSQPSQDIDGRSLVLAKTNHRWRGSALYTTFKKRVSFQIPLCAHLCLLCHIFCFSQSCSRSFFLFSLGWFILDSMATYRPTDQLPPRTHFSTTTFVCLCSCVCVHHSAVSLSPFDANCLKFKCHRLLL